MKKAMYRSILILFLLAGTAFAAEPAAESHEHGNGTPAAENTQKPADDKDMPMTMPRRQGMKGMAGGMECDKMGKGDGGMGMGKDCGKMGKGDGGMGMGCGKMGMGGGGCCMGHSDALVKQDLLQTLQEMVKVQEQLADLLKGKDRARLMKELDQIAKRLDRMQADLRSAPQKGHGGHGMMKHDGKMKHGGHGEMKH